MTDQFYSLPTDDALFLNYVTTQQRALTQTQSQQFVSNGQSANMAAIPRNEYNYTQGSTYFSRSSIASVLTDGVVLNSKNRSLPSVLCSYGNNTLGYGMHSYVNAGTYVHLPGQYNDAPNSMYVPATAEAHLMAHGNSDTTFVGIAPEVSPYVQQDGSNAAFKGGFYMPYHGAHGDTSAPLNASSATSQKCGGVSSHMLPPGVATSAARNGHGLGFNKLQQNTSLYRNSANTTLASTSMVSGSGGDLSSGIFEMPSNGCTRKSQLSYEHTTTSGMESALKSTLTYNPETFKLPCVSDTIVATPVTSACVDGSNTAKGYGYAQAAHSSTVEGAQIVTLQITNLDYTMDESGLRHFLLNQLQSITPVLSLVFEGNSYAKITVPDLYFAKLVVSSLHRKRIGHKRMLVSYTRDSSLTEINTLRCQVAGLLKDVPYYTLPMYKFRELFQSRFKTSISVLDLYKMQDICSINADNNEDKFISLQAELVNSLETSPLIEGLQHSVPYCTIHFKREQHKGWAEQDIEPLPNVCMTIREIQRIIYPLLKRHTGDIPVASLVHCIEGELKVQIKSNDKGVNLEHLICCVQGIQIQVNNFGIKILSWLELDKEQISSIGGANTCSAQERSLYSKNSVSDPLYQISREVIELVKISPKSTMKFNRFIPAYHNHFGKQCRVADYGYTKLIELFEALSSVVQIMGDGENRLITLTHRTQIRRFTCDLLRVLRSHGNKSVLLSQLPTIFAQTQSRNFDVTDYGVCQITDILDGLVNSNVVVVSTVQTTKDILISIPQRTQTHTEMEKTCVFAGEMVELFRNAPQYMISFHKFVRSYHYHFLYQCRLNDYGFLKLADLMEAIHGVVEMDLTNIEDKKIFLSPKVAQRVFAEQCSDLIQSQTGCTTTRIKLDEVLAMHKKKYGYQIQPQTLGVKSIRDAIELLPYVETFHKEKTTWITCHHEDAIFRMQSYHACNHILASESEKPIAEIIGNKSGSENKISTQRISLKLSEFLTKFNEKHSVKLTEHSIKAMKHALEIFIKEEVKYVRTTKFMNFLISIVRLLEQRNQMMLHDIKTACEFKINTTFEFGYPNLFSLLIAYPDVFSVNVAVSQDRSEVTLQPSCELGVNSTNSSKLTKDKSTRVVPVPLSEFNGRLTSAQGPPAKTRIVTYNVPKNLPQSPYVAINSGNHSQYITSSHQAQTLMPVLGHLQEQQNFPSCTSSNSNSTNSKGCKKYTNTSSSSIYSISNKNLSSTLNNSISSLNASNKENSLNNSMNMFNGSFNSSTNSLNEFNNSVGNLVHTGRSTSQKHQYLRQMQFDTNSLNVGAASQMSTKLTDRRMISVYQQHATSIAGTELDAVVNTTVSGVYAPPIQNGFAQLPLQLTASSFDKNTGVHELHNNIGMCPLYEPPKPDSPPSNNMPFWINPIWANPNAELQPKTDDSLNIKLPELQNVLPMLLSPYTISKTKNMKQVFNFDNHDRKIY